MLFCRSLQLSPTPRARWMVELPCSGSRSRASASGAPALVRQRRCWHAGSAATANGACARQPAPPTFKCVCAHHPKPPQKIQVFAGDAPICQRGRGLGQSGRRLHSRLPQTVSARTVFTSKRRPTRTAAREVSRRTDAPTPCPRTMQARSRTHATTKEEKEKGPRRALTQKQGKPDPGRRGTGFAGPLVAPPGGGDVRSAARGWAINA